MSKRKSWHSRRRKLYITNPGAPADRLALIIYRVTRTDFDARNGVLPLGKQQTFPLLRGRVSFLGRTYHVGGGSVAQVVARLTLVIMTDENLNPPRNQKIP